jgi:hypothetical protein
LFKKKTPTLNTHVTSKLYVDTAVNKKQNTLTFINSLVLNSIVVKPAVSELVYTPAISGEIKATTLTIEDLFTEESINLKDTLNSKQNILIAGNNITITNDTISSSGGGSDITQEDLNLKQDKLDATSALSVDRVSTLGDITSGGNLMYYDIFFGYRNIRNVFFATNSAIDLKQDMINFLTNLTCATIDCSNLNIGGESIDT